MVNSNLAIHVFRETVAWYEHASVKWTELVVVVREFGV
jgi:hypothetical protein